MDSVDIEQLKSDPEFLENLKKLEEEVANSDSLAKLYQLLDAKLAINANEDEVNELFQKAVASAFNILSEKIANAQGLDLSNPEEWAVARAIYEHGIERYSSGDTKAATELFLALNFTVTNEEIKDAMMVHAAAVGSGYSFDDFFNKLTKVSDADFSDPMAVFVTDFVQPTDILLEMMKDEVVKLNERLDKLKKAQEES